MPAPIEPLESRTYFTHPVPILSVNLPNALPTQEVTGLRQNLTVEVDVTDLGTGPAVGRFPLSLYATAKGSFLGFGSLKKLVTLFPAEHFFPDQTTVIDVVIPSFPTSLDGSFFVAAQIAYKANGYPDEASGITTSQVSLIPPQPDLTGVFSSVPTTIVAGKSLVVELIVTNAGNKTASGPLGVSFSFSDDSAATTLSSLTTLRRRVVLGAGKSQKVRFSIPIPKTTLAGADFLVADLDPSNLFIESDLNDKRAISPDAITVS